MREMIEIIIICIVLEIIQVLDVITDYYLRHQNKIHVYEVNPLIRKIENNRFLEYLVNSYKIILSLLWFYLIVYFYWFIFALIVIEIIGVNVIVGNLKIIKEVRK